MEIGLNKLRESGDKLLLLGLFALGLGLAQLLIRVRSRVELSEPLRLDESLSVSVPAGAGWQAVQRSRPPGAATVHEINAGLFVGKTPTVTVEIRYVQAADGFDAQAYLEERVGRQGLQCDDGGQIRLRRLTVQWVQGVTANGSVDVCYGVAQVGAAGRIEIEVSAKSDPEHANRIFRAVVGSIEYQPIVPSGKDLALGGVSEVKERLHASEL